MSDLRMNGLSQFVSNRQQPAVYPFILGDEMMGAGHDI